MSLSQCVVVLITLKYTSIECADISLNIKVGPIVISHAEHNNVYHKVHIF